MISYDACARLMGNSKRMIGEWGWKDGWFSEAGLLAATEDLSRHSRYLRRRRMSVSPPRPRRAVVVGSGTAEVSPLRCECLERLVMAKAGATCLQGDRVGFAAVERCEAAKID